ncbi:hypothetical protein PHISCL_09824 [Aspergillus sclerotialis]|uniref:Uncharacterized protein n=1 Tax=Aspergillus sclerotialis TaxID=2070753 RepID=A0A3A2ZL07_9EURO|nr:hypothetical protein PHISCL_09824 [Aspergillus sclerotialis]
MSFAYVASKTNPDLILPPVAATAYAVSTDPEYNTAILYKDVESVGPQEEKVKLQTDNGDSSDAAGMPYFEERMA